MPLFTVDPTPLCFNPYSTFYMFTRRTLCNEIYIEIIEKSKETLENSMNIIAKSMNNLVKSMHTMEQPTKNHGTNRWTMQIAHSWLRNSAKYQVFLLQTMRCQETKLLRSTCGDGRLQWKPNEHHMDLLFQLMRIDMDRVKVLGGD